MDALRQAAQAALDKLNTGELLCEVMAASILDEALSAPEQKPVAVVLNGHYQQRGELEDGIVHKLYTAQPDIEALTKERDALKSSNDSYITLANTAYEITEQCTLERDEWKNTAIQRGSEYIKTLNERDALAADIRQMSDDLVAIEKMRREKDARMYADMHKLKEAAKLALDALSVSYPTVRSRLRAHNAAIETLKKAGV